MSSTDPNVKATYFLRPVEGKGLRPIPLSESEGTVVGRSKDLGILDNKVSANLLECKLTYSPMLAVELKAKNEVFVKDRFGVLKMLKANYVGYLKPGEVLYLYSSQSVPKYGYILTKGESDNAGHTGADDFIELLDESSDDDVVEAAPPPSDRTAPPVSPEGTRREGRADARAGREGGHTAPRRAVKRQRDDRKGTADDPCELLSSDEEEEEVKVQFTSKAKSARGRKSTKRNAFYGGQESGGGGDSSHGTANARYKPQQTERDAQRNARAQQQRGYGSAHGAGPTTGSQSAQHFTADNVQPKPPTPPPSHPDDTPEVSATRATLQKAWIDLCAAQDKCDELFTAVRSKQIEYQRVTLEVPSRFNGDTDSSSLKEHNMRVNNAAAEMHLAMNEYNDIRGAIVVLRAKYQRAREELDTALQLLERGRRAAAQTRRDETKASDFQAEVEAWETVERTPDLSTIPVSELKQLATAMGVDIRGCVEKKDLATAITTRRESGREAWLVKRKKRAAEEEIAVRQRRKLAELRKDESKRQADESAQASAKQRAVRQVATWGKNADLRVFLQRCGIPVEGVGRNKKSLTAAYRRAMMKYHPDRTRGASMEQQALAAEVTKWITHEWQNLS